MENQIAPLGIVEITESNLRLMREQLLEIPAMPETKEQYITAKNMHIQAKKVLPRIESCRKELKKKPLEECRLIDTTAKTAISMISPLIEMAGTRRAVWEDRMANEKAVAQAVEKDRLDAILDAMKSLKIEVDACTAYNVPAERIKVRIEILEKTPVTEEIFQEHLIEAVNIQDNGIIDAYAALKNRIAFEADLADLEKQQKAQDEAQAKIDADNKAEADRLAKLDANQKAAAAKTKADAAKVAKKILSDQIKAQAKIDAERAEFEAEKAAEQKRQENEAMARAEKQAAILEAARVVERDNLCDEALPIHIAKYVLPAALSMNLDYDLEKLTAMDAAAKRKKLLMKDRNAAGKMASKIRDILEDGFILKTEDVKNLVQGFRNEVDALISALDNDINILR